MLAPPVAEDRVTPGLGWPRKVEVDPRIGWPTVPRETLDWTKTASAVELDSQQPNCCHDNSVPSRSRSRQVRDARALMRTSSAHLQLRTTRRQMSPPQSARYQSHCPPRHFPASSSSPTRRAASARPQRASTWRLLSPSAGSRCSWWISIPRETLRLRSELTIHPARRVRTRC